ncbi:MAG: hemerythrin domain-containing protein [Bacteroidales bacterium]|nr:hemerythrin domain-containing protein [Bacteroidales bacterium]
MSDILLANSNILLLLPRLGIKLGFGDRSVIEVCQQNQVSPLFVIMVCNCYTFDDYEPDVSTFSNDDLRSLVPYLVASHNYYVNERLPHIERHLNHVAAQAGMRYAESLHKFFLDYRDEVVFHFAYEEANVFPNIEKCLSNQPMSKTSTGFMSKSHDAIVDKLSDLTQIIFKYVPINGLDEELNELVFAILQLSFDLEKHAMIEDKIVLPLLARQEAGRK